MTLCLTAKRISHFALLIMKLLLALLLVLLCCMASAKQWCYRQSVSCPQAEPECGELGCEMIVTMQACYERFCFDCEDAVPAGFTRYANQECNGTGHPDLTLS